MFVATTILLSSCSVKKFIPKGEKLYTGASLKVKAKEPIKGKKKLRYELEDVLEPSPNKSVFGIRYGLYFHFKVQEDNSGKIINRLNKRFGEKPVYLSSIDANRTEVIINNRCENTGFFYAEVSSEIVEKKQTASINYTVKVSRPYLLETYHYNRDSTAIDTLIEKALKNTRLTKGTRFDTEKFKAERQRIDYVLKNQGYFGFNSKFLIFTSDTNHYNDRKFDLYLSFKTVAPQEVLRPYEIRKVTVIMGNGLQVNDSLSSEELRIDSVDFMQSEADFIPSKLRPFVTIEPNDLYNKRASDLTSRRFSSIGAFELVSVRYTRIDTNDLDTLGLLNANIFLSPSKKQDVRLEFQTVTKSNSFAGPGLIGSYQNRNLFGGGERLNLSGNISYETQIAGNSSQGLSTFEFKALSSITFPRLISIVKINPEKGYLVPSTKFSLNYTLQQRALYYNLNSLLFSYGYNFKFNPYLFMAVNPISINYTNVAGETELFKNILNSNPFLERSFDDQFILGGTANLQYSQLGLKNKQSRFFFNLGLDLAGNLIGLVQDVSNQENNLFNLSYARYVKADIDLRHYLKIARESQLVARAFAGAGFPYGDSQSLPFIKQYFSGGPNSLRAFRVRSVGPGSYNPSDSSGNISFFDQSGDIKLEANLEFRHPLYSLLKGAVFVDAGNIWLWNENSAIPGGKFGSNWSQEIAIGIGYGVRLDIQFLIIRLDASIPLRYPYEVNGTHWQNRYSLGQKSWRQENLIWNFAIGYPF